MDGDYNVNLAEYLRQKKLMGPNPYAGLQIPGQTSTVAVDPPKNSNQVTDTGYPLIQPKAPDETPAMSAFKAGVAKEPLAADYHPSKLRQVLAAIAGGVVGAGNGGQAGANVGASIRNAPYNREHANYSQQQAQRGQLAGMEQQDVETKAANELSQAKIGELGARTEAENQRGRAEAHKASEYLPTSLDEATKLKQASVRPPTPVPDQIFMDSSGNATAVPRTVGGAPITPGAVSAPKPLGQFGPNKVAEENDRALRNEKFTKSLHDSTMANANARTDKQIAAGREKQQAGFDYRTDAPTTNMKDTAERAKVTLKATARARPQIDKLEAQLGPGAGRWNDFWNGKVGLPDADLARLRADLEYVTAAAVRAHTSRGDQNMMKNFENLNNTKFRSPGDMKAFLDSTDAIMSDYANYKTRDATSGSPSAPVSGGGFAEWDAARRKK